jgi:hypothetical protein
MHGSNLQVRLFTLHKQPLPIADAASWLIAQPFRFHGMFIQEATWRWRSSGYVEELI